MFMKKELLEGLTDEQIEKIKNFDNIQDLLQLAKDEGIELNQEQLEAINGGGCDSNKPDKINTKDVNS